MAFEAHGTDDSGEGPGSGDASTQRKKNRPIYESEEKWEENETPLKTAGVWFSCGVTSPESGRTFVTNLSVFVDRSVNSLLFEFGFSVYQKVSLLQTG
ncbi:hypothetical protein RRG08_066585 [Elysia crispata]|uniref:Uncharacterized protein n=1 Tax=Elysia crispata TaxID=231223 RepID=A0AAE0XSR6_9GAST|nr:hypothetical protein RRG08_066585 [Elysia crispata]